MSQVFISYAHEDLERVRDIASVLEKQGLTVFWDRQIPAGQTWRGYIGKALGDAVCVLVVWSRASVNSRWVIEEADEALKKELLVPVLLEQVEPPLGFRGIQAADLTDWRKGAQSPQIQQLLEDIGKIIGNKLPDVPERSVPKEPPDVRQEIVRIAPKDNFPIKNIVLAAVLVVVAVIAGVALFRSFMLSPDNHITDRPGSTAADSISAARRARMDSIRLHASGRSGNGETEPIVSHDSANSQSSENIEIQERVTDDIIARRKWVEQSLRSAGIVSYTIRDIRNQGDGYLVVIGSYTDVREALDRVSGFQRTLSKNVKLFYSINNYYAAAIGVFDNMEKAKAEKGRVTSIIADAYIYKAAALPLEISVKIR
jgi:hypothetical protein